ncbi:MAG: LytR C-terminal domain-containing protein [Calditrichaeota bacterium]|nr:LytR C-terminal domain-containing protein [Calditrichota bacterium]MCB9368182.1 LytR C-terminal domain-containing protein [Calditrichota bacterium]
MSKRFYPTQDFAHAKKTRKFPRWPWYGFAALLLVAAFWISSGSDWTGESSPRVRPVRETIASTETSSQLASIQPADTGEYDLSVSVDSILAANADTVSPDTIHEEVPASQKEIKKKVAAAKLPSVTLFNGCGVKGVGKRAKAALEKMGFDIVEVRNARSFEYAKSEVLDRRESRAYGKVLADSLGIPVDLAAWDTTRSDKNADVSLIVGADYRKLKWKLQ